MYASKSATITPHDTNVINDVPQAIIVSVDGSYNIKLLNDAAVKAHYLVAGLMYPIRPIIIQNTGLPSGAVVVGYYTK